MLERSWYVVQCKAKESFRAAENLKNQGFEVFHPVIEIEKLRANKIQCALEPLFPYYLFIQLSDVADNWRPIRSTRGVLKLVAFGCSPVKISTDLIAQLKQQVQPTPEKLFKSGDQVLIDEGPFKGLKAIFASTQGDERVVLLLDLLQQQQRITLACHAIQQL